MIWTLALALAVTSAVAQDTGRIEGTVSRDDGSGVGGVTVVVSETGDAQLTAGDGSYRFDGVPPGTYTIAYTMGDDATTEGGVTVTAGNDTTVDKSVDWDVSFAETITVFSASRRRERIVDAPAAITVVSEQEISRESATGQIAKVLEFTPGVEIIQSGLYDFNLNTRGFNSSLNRRVQTLIDGREASVNFLGSTEWGPLSGVMQDLASIELVRGPSSALYGANAFNGVLNLTTRSGRDSVGGKASLSVGELSTLRADLVWGTGLGNDWYLKLIGNYGEGDDFTLSRVGQVEYPGLPGEIAVPTNTFESTSLGVRLDKYFGGGRQALTIEGGTYSADGGVAVTGIGRVNLSDVDREWGRFNFSAAHYNVLAYFSNRDAPGQTALASGGRLFQDTKQVKVEVQGNQTFANDKIRVVGGLSYKEDDVDTANNQGIQTTTRNASVEDYQAVFGQVDFDLGKKVKLVLATRYDESSLHDSQFSPKAALVWSVADKHTLRFSYNEAFQVANFSEFFLKAPTAIPGVGASVDLGGIEAALCTPFGINCGFGSPTRVLALGNENLTLEEISGFEVGYSGIIGDKGFLTIDYYNNELENFITDLITNPFGSVNPTFGPYQAPAGHPLGSTLEATLAGALGPLIAFLSNDLDGTPIFALASYANAGKADTQGIDVGFNYYITPQWIYDFTYSWFDFELTEGSVGTDTILPNAPEHKFSTGITYNGPKFGGSLKYRWVEDFLWAAGSFVGEVESYNVVNLTGYYDINERVSLGLNISNLLNDEHFEIFGGDILERRAIGYIKFNW